MTAAEIDRAARPGTYTPPQPVTREDERAALARVAAALADDPPAWLQAEIEDQRTCAVCIFAPDCNNPRPCGLAVIEMEA